MARIISKRTNGPSRHVRFQPAGDDQQSQPYLVTISSRVAGYQADAPLAGRTPQPVSSLLLLVRLQSHPDFEFILAGLREEGGRGRYRCAGGGV